MDDAARWLKDREALGFSKRGEARALRSFREMLGAVFAELTVESYEKLYPRRDGKGAEPVWVCRCVCGGAVSMRTSALQNGDRKNCGRCAEKLGTNWTELQLRRLALSVEFEGTLGVYSVAGPKLIIGVRDYSDVLVRTLCAEFGMGNVTYAQPKWHGRIAQWQVTGLEAAVLARHVAPYMVCKKQQAELVAGFSIKSHSSGKVTAEIQSERMRLRARTKELNRRGPRDPDPAWAPLAAEWIAWAANAPAENRYELLAWAIEWEGYICIREKPSASSVGGLTHSPVVGLSQVAHRGCLLNVVNALSGGLGKLSGVLRPQRETWAPMQCWTVTGFTDAKRLAAGLAPHLKCKKRLAELVQEFPEWPHAPEPMPKSVLDKRRELAAESKLVNAYDYEYRSLFEEDDPP